MYDGYKYKYIEALIYQRHKGMLIQHVRLLDLNEHGTVIVNPVDVKHFYEQGSQGSDEASANG
jgi:hypothetical protein